MKVTVKTLDGNNHDFDVPDSHTIIQFKELISQRLEVPVDRIRIIFQGRILEDSISVEQAGISERVVHVVNRPPPGLVNPQPFSSNLPNNASSPISMVQNNFGLDQPGVDVIGGIINTLFNNLDNANTTANGSNRRQFSTAEGAANVNNVSNSENATSNEASSQENANLTTWVSMARMRQRHFQSICSNQLNSLLARLNELSLAAGLESSETTHGSVNSQAMSLGTASLDELMSQPLGIRVLGLILGGFQRYWNHLIHHLPHWQSILRDWDSCDPQNSDQRRLNDQEFFDTFSSALHLISHLLHNASDFMIDLSLPHPRNLMVLSGVSSPELVEASFNITSEPANNEFLSANNVDVNNISTNVSSGLGNVSNPSAPTTFVGGDLPNLLQRINFGRGASSVSVHSRQATASNFNRARSGVHVQPVSANSNIDSTNETSQPTVPLSNSNPTSNANITNLFNNDQFEFSSEPDPFLLCDSRHFLNTLRSFDFTLNQGESANGTNSAPTTQSRNIPPGNLNPLINSFANQDAMNMVMSFTRTALSRFVNQSQSTEPNPNANTVNNDVRTPQSNVDVRQPPTSVPRTQVYTTIPSQPQAANTNRVFLPTGRRVLLGGAQFNISGGPDTSPGGLLMMGGFSNPSNLNSQSGLIQNSVGNLDMRTFLNDARDISQRLLRIISLDCMPLTQIVHDLNRVDSHREDMDRLTLTSVYLDSTSSSLTNEPIFDFFRILMEHTRPSMGTIQLATFLESWIHRLEERNLSSTTVEGFSTFLPSASLLRPFDACRVGMCNWLKALENASQISNSTHDLAFKLAVEWVLTVEWTWLRNLPNNLRSIWIPVFITLTKSHLSRLIHSIRQSQAYIGFGPLLWIRLVRWQWNLMQLLRCLILHESTNTALRNHYRTNLNEINSFNETWSDGLRIFCGNTRASLFQRYISSYDETLFMLINRIRWSQLLFGSDSCQPICGVLLDLICQLTFVIYHCIENGFSSTLQRNQGVRERAERNILHSFFPIEERGSTLSTCVFELLELINFDLTNGGSAPIYNIISSTSSEPSISWNLTADELALCTKFNSSGFQSLITQDTSNVGCSENSSKFNMSQADDGFMTPPQESTDDIQSQILTNNSLKLNGSLERPLQSVRKILDGDIKHPNVLSMLLDQSDINSQSDRELILNEISENWLPVIANDHANMLSNSSFVGNTLKRNTLLEKLSTPDFGLNAFDSKISLGQEDSVNSLSSQLLLSDAYLAGMPAKRRRLAEQQKSELFCDSSVLDLLCECLKKSILKSHRQFDRPSLGVVGVPNNCNTLVASKASTSQSTMNPNELGQLLNKSIMENDEIVQSFTAMLGSLITERIYNDPDFQPEKFPDSAKKFHFDEK